MKRALLYSLILVMVVALAGCSTLPTPFPMPTKGQPTVARATDPSSPAPEHGSGSADEATVQVELSPEGDPFALISSENLYAVLEDLTAIQPYSGWRNSASSGEAEGLDYIAGRLADLGYLASLGMEQERQTFRVPTATEIWRACDGQLTADDIAKQIADRYGIEVKLARADVESTLQQLEEKMLVQLV